MRTKKIFLASALIVLFALSLSQVLAGEYGTGAYGTGGYGIGPDSTANPANLTPVIIPTPNDSNGGAGGGAGGGNSGSGAGSSGGSGGGSGGGGGYVPPNALAKPQTQTPGQISPPQKTEDSAQFNTIDASLMNEVHTLLSDFSSQDTTTKHLDTYERDVHNALSANDQERASQLVNQLTTIHDDAQQAKSIIDGLQQQMYGAGTNADAASGNAPTVTGNVIARETTISGTGNMPVTQSLLDRATVYYNEGDYSTALVLAKQAQASYAIEQNAHNSPTGMLQSYGPAILLAIFLLGIALVARKDAMKLRKEALTDAAPGTHGLWAMLTAEIALVKRRFAKLPPRGWGALIFIIGIICAGMIGTYILYTGTNHALQNLEDTQVELGAEHVGENAEMTIMNAQAVGEDLESLIVTNVDVNAAQQSKTYAEEFLNRSSADFLMIGNRASQVDGIYVYSDPDQFGLHYRWYVRQNGSMVPKADVHENETGYLSANASADIIETESTLWYYNVMRNNTPQWTSVYYDPDVKTFMVSYLRPIMMRGHFIGMVGIDVNLAELRSALAMENEIDGRYILVDSTGQFIVGSPSMVSDWNGTLALMKGASGGMQVGEQDIGYHRLSNGMLAVTVLPEGTASLSAETMQAVALCILILLEMVFLIAGAYATSKLLRLHSEGIPASKLSRWTRTFAAVALILLVLSLAGIFSWMNHELIKLEDNQLTLQADEAAGHVDMITKYIESTGNDLVTIIASDFNTTLARNNKSYTRAYINGKADEFKMLSDRSTDVAGSYVYFDTDKFGVNYLWYNHQNGTMARRFDTEENKPGYLSMSSKKWRNDPNYVWYYDTLLTGRPEWSASYYDTDLHYNCVSYLQPVFVNHQIVASAGIDMGTSGLNMMLDENRGKYDTIIIDKDGVAIYGNQDLLPDWNGTLQQMTEDRGGFQYGGKDIGYHKLSNGMTAIIISKQDLSANTLNMLRGGVFMKLGIMAFVFACIAAYFFFAQRKSRQPPQEERGAASTHEQQMVQQPAHLTTAHAAHTAQPKSQQDTVREFISHMRKLSSSDERIKQKLLEAGWPPKFIDQALLERR